ncbi:hypothetical protein [Streptomyces sp. JV180]|uniref:hypothetical protein n=1 Tax=Streptomyces sp. JV180 TaxID=858634 RepID=UPI00168B7AE1|nr:hypothetical protein [Streptomyces sp. JV180]MBD3549999.1 hypothetical protein [Streptomyces sp. JV180]
MDPLDDILARAAQRQQELDQMHADYEVIDAAEYAQFNAEQDVRDAARTTDT